MGQDCIAKARENSVRVVKTENVFSIKLKCLIFNRILTFSIGKIRMAPLHCSSGRLQGDRKMDKSHNYGQAGGRLRTPTFWLPLGRRWDSRRQRPRALSLQLSTWNTLGEVTLCLYLAR